MGSDAPRYWRAETFARSLHDSFELARQRRDAAAMREAYYHVAYFHARTRAILRRAIDDRDEALIQAALRNLQTLHATLQAMHTAARHVVPGTVSRLREARRLPENLIMSLLQQHGALPARALTDLVSKSALLADVHEPLVLAHLAHLTASGHAAAVGSAFAATDLPYRAGNFDELELQSLFSESLARTFEQAGFHGISDMSAREDVFRTLFRDLTGTGEATGRLFVETAAAIAEPEAVSLLSAWRHADLLGSTYPRRYQLEAYNLLRGLGYRAQVLEAPAGSGKTLIGMLCIQDWLTTLAQGETILILAPTMNDQQQWMTELCLKKVGLRMPLSLVYGGAPGKMASARREGRDPCVLVLTYASLSQIGSGTGKGGFDRDSVEMFLQEHDVQYVILDEVHKTAEIPSSTTAEVARLLVVWLNYGSIRGIIGFSGTAGVLREQLQEIGLSFAGFVPERDLIAEGFVSAFGEFGVPFAYSERERRIRRLLDEYKAELRNVAGLIGGQTLRRWFAAIPMSERVAAARDLLGMYAHRPDRDLAIALRLSRWEAGGELTLAEMPLITLVQIANGWPDERMVAQVRLVAASDYCDIANQYRILHERVLALRSELKDLMQHADLTDRLATPGFGTRLDISSLRGSIEEHETPDTSRNLRKAILATTIVGLYEGLREWYARQGESRAETVRAIIEAEQACRPIHGVIVYDAARRFQRSEGVASADTRGAPAVFAELLGKVAMTPMAVLSSEIYLPHNAQDPLAARVAVYVRRVVMAGELTTALIEMLIDRIDLTESERQTVRAGVTGALLDYGASLGKLRGPRHSELWQAVLRPLSLSLQQALSRPARLALRERLRRGNPYLHAWVRRWFDYARIADSFETAPVFALDTRDGQRHQIAVVSMPQGQRKSMVYELAGRIIDAEELPVNVAIVTAWARTGWNVITPDVLIDATGTRDPIAWQQLRGRALRPMSTWTNDCAAAVAFLMIGVPGAAAGEMRTSESRTAFEQSLVVTQKLSEAARSLLREAFSDAQAKGAGWAQTDEGRELWASIRDCEQAAGPAPARLDVAAELMAKHNKTAHIYELVKGYGGNVQVRWQRGDRKWIRKEAVEAKYRHEIAVNPVTGAFVRGPEHSPLLYAGDPRHDLPDATRLHLEQWLPDRDRIIVRGWLGATVDARESGSVADLELV